MAGPALKGPGSSPINRATSKQAVSRHFPAMLGARKGARCPGTISPAAAAAGRAAMAARGARDRATPAAAVDASRSRGAAPPQPGPAATRAARRRRRRNLSPLTLIAILVVVAALVAYNFFTFRVQPDELGVVLRFGSLQPRRPARPQLPPAVSDRDGLHAEGHAREPGHHRPGRRTIDIGARPAATSPRRA